MPTTSVSDPVQQWACPASRTSCLSMCAIYATTKTDAHFCPSAVNCLACGAAHITLLPACGSWRCMLCHVHHAVPTCVRITMQALTAFCTTR